MTRQPSTTDFPALTGLRGVAALWVMACHCWYYLGTPELKLGPVDLGKLMALGWIGVLVFFVLSGFLLAQPFIAWRRDDAPRPSTAQYLYRRLLRVFPAYYFQLAILLLLAWTVNSQALIADLRSALSHIFMFFHIGPQPVRPIVGVWWTLPVELGFYLVLPLLAMLMNRRLGIAVLLASTFAISMFHHYLGELWLYDQSIFDRSNFVRQLPGYLCIFALGCAARWYWPGLRPYFDRTRYVSMILAGVALLALLALMYMIPLDEGGLEFWNNPAFYYLWKPAAGLAIALAVLACTERKLLLVKLLSSRPSVWLGDISYSLYLWHLPIILLIRDWASARGLSAPFVWLLILTLTLLISWLSALLIEQPFIALGRKSRKPAGKT